MTLTIAFQHSNELTNDQDFASVDAACEYAEANGLPGEWYAIRDEHKRVIPGCEYTVPDDRTGIDEEG